MILREQLSQEELDAFYNTRIGYIMKKYAPLFLVDEATFRAKTLFTEMPSDGHFRGESCCYQYCPDYNLDREMPDNLINRLKYLHYLDVKGFAKDLSTRMEGLK